MARPNKLEKFVKNGMFEGRYESEECEAINVHDLLNRYIFNNTLACPAFNIKRTRGYWGMCDGRFDKDGDFHTAQIILNYRFPHKAMFVATIAHEMVHQWQWEVLNPIREQEGKPPLMSHGPSFYQWRPALNKYYIPLTKEY
jgi:hypothetical protein